MLRPKIVLAVAVALAFGFGARSASADLQFDLNVGNAAISSFPGPYAHVDVALSGDTATITVTGLTNGINDYLMHGNNALGVEVNAQLWTFGTVSASISLGNPPFTGPSPSNGGVGNEDGFGTFNQTINLSDGFKSSADTIQFTITNKTHNGWASASDVLTANQSGSRAAAAIGVYQPTVSTTGFATTGFAGDGTPNVVPEPSTLAIAGLGALGFIGFGLRRRLTK
jgi:hypothetical protein